MTDTKNQHDNVSPQQAMQIRRNELEAWLNENGADCASEHRHLDAETPEQIYWHFGYLTALIDALTLLENASAPTTH